MKWHSSIIKDHLCLAKDAGLSSDHQPPAANIVMIVDMF